MWNKKDRIFYLIMKFFQLLIGFLIVTLIAYLFVIQLVGHISPTTVETFLEVEHSWTDWIGQLWNIMWAWRNILYFLIFPFLVTAFMRVIIGFWKHFPRKKTIWYTLLMFFCGYVAVPCMIILDDEISANKSLKSWTRLFFWLRWFFILASASRFITRAAFDIINIMNVATVGAVEEGVRIPWYVGEGISLPF